MKISKHFNRDEFACKCGCDFKAVDAQLLEILEDLRTEFNKPITITSGCRCEAHNKAIRGSKNSQHIKGMACDIVIKDTSTVDVYKYLNELYPSRLGIGLYKNFIHIDVRDLKARWSKLIFV